MDTSKAREHLALPTAELIAKISGLDLFIFIVLIARRHLVKFWGVHKNAEQSLRAWYDEVINAKWTKPQDIKNSYRNASFVGNNRVIFNIKGNDYRLIVAVAYQFGAVYVKFIGTHAEYDAIDAKTVNMEGV